MTDPEGVRPADSPSTLLNQFLELNPDTRRTGPATAARPCRCGGEVQFTDHGDRVAWKCVEGTCGKSGAFTAADLAARSKRQAPPAPGFILGDEDTPAPSGSRPALPVELDPGPLMLALLELAGDGSHDEPMDPGEADARMLDARRHGWDALPDRVKVRCKMSIGARVDPDHFRIVLGGVDFKTKAWKLPAAGGRRRGGRPGAAVHGVGRGRRRGAARRVGLARPYRAGLADAALRRPWRR